MPTLSVPVLKRSIFCLAHFVWPARTSNSPYWQDNASVLSFSTRAFFVFSTHNFSLHPRFSDEFFLIFNLRIMFFDMFSSSICFCPQRNAILSRQPFLILFWRIQWIEKKRCSFALFYRILSAAVGLRTGAGKIWRKHANSKLMILVNCELWILCLPSDCRVALW